MSSCNKSEPLYVHLPNRDADESTEATNRWQKIQTSLMDLKVKSSYELEVLIRSYNEPYSSSLTFRGLHKLFSERSSPPLDASLEHEKFWNATLPKMADCAMRLSELLQEPIPLLRKQRPGTVWMTQEQVACLLCNAFFCTFPERPSETIRQRALRLKTSPSVWDTFPSINFNRLFEQCSPNALEKLKCLLHYFEKVTEHMEVGSISFERKVLLPADELHWSSCQLPLCKLTADSSKLIEDAGGMLQVDFANRKIGGGVLGWGCVQEEIRFVICPELLVSRLFTEELDVNETVQIQGIQRYACYSGYANTFKFSGGFTDDEPRDSFGRRRTTILAMDAQKYGSKKKERLQYTTRGILCDLNKAYCGFRTTSAFDECNAGRRAQEMVSLEKSVIATGNWGCGAYGGNKYLKAMIQWLAASATGKQLAYSTFGDETLAGHLNELSKSFAEKNMRVAGLYAILLNFKKEDSERFEDYLMKLA